MKSGMDYIVETAINKLLANLPPETVDNVRQIASTIATFKGQMDRIEKQNEMILRYIVPKKSGGDIEIVDHYDKPNQNFDTGGNLLPHGNNGGGNPAGK